MATATCTITAKAALGASSLAIRSITVPAPSAGWAMTTTPAGTIADGVTTISPGITLRAGQEWSFSIQLSPACTAPDAAGLLAITSKVANSNGAAASVDVAGPGLAWTATATTPPTSVQASAVSGPMHLSFTSAFEDQVANGEFRYRVVAAGCAAWEVSVPAGDFRAADSGATIAAGNLRLVSNAVPVIESGDRDGVVAPPAMGGLGTPRRAMAVPAGERQGVYEQTIGIVLTLPANTPPGTYTSTITITTGVAP